MNQINTIHINNFKFFGESDPIEISGKHLLLYGENGSGKSSLFWALYTLLESVQKSDEKLIQYFTQGDDAGLVNIYAQPVAGGNWNSFISLTLKDGSTYRIAVDDFGAKARPNAQATHRGSDFLNYRFMFKLHDFRHKDEIDLFALFQKEVFPYVSTRNRFELMHESRRTQDFNEIWDDLKKGMPEVYAESVAEDDPRRVKQEYARRVRAFAEELNSLLTDINNYGNQLLQEKLGYLTIRFQVGCPLSYLQKKDEDGENIDDLDEPILPLQITLTIPEYDTLGAVIKRPQSFLNEAKLTAIGIAIRLAILQRRSDYATKADFRLLVLDDLLISLDMANRQTVLDLILDKYSYQSQDEKSKNDEKVKANGEKFQVFILTHDAQLNHFVKSQIKVRGKEFADDWKCIDMYEHVENGVKKAVIVNNDSHLEKARQYFYAKKPDYEAAGNCLRKEAEEFTKSFLPKRQQVGRDFTPLDLSGRIQKCIDYANNNGLDTIPFKALYQHREFIFNVLSHDDYDVPRFRSEIGKCFKTFDKHLNKIEYRQVLNEEEQLVIELHDGANLYKAVITIYEPLILIKEPSKDSILAKVFANYQMYKDGIKNGKTCTEPLNIQRLYDKWYATSDKAKSADFWEEVIISKTGEKLSTLRIF